MSVNVHDGSDPLMSRQHVAPDKMELQKVLAHLASHSMLTKSAVADG